MQDGDYQRPYAEGGYATGNTKGDARNYPNVEHVIGLVERIVDITLAVTCSLSQLLVW